MHMSDLISLQIYLLEANDVCLRLLAINSRRQRTAALKSRNSEVRLPRFQTCFARVSYVRITSPEIPGVEEKSLPVAETAMLW